MTDWASTLKWCDDKREAERKRLYERKRHPATEDEIRDYVEDLWKLITSYRFKITQLEHPELYNEHA